ncbi:seminase-like [Drosophila bipectinata]|uniref:seminase-like n=1 Tax=Drosophila bipectinata TaxID=42026 RepID=UPI001C898457|nr:seminase-like [Drosophila bipectinata]
MQKLLAYLLLLIFFQWKDVLGLNLNQTVDVVKLAKLVQPSGPQGRVIGGEVTTSEKLGGYLVVLRYTKDFVCGGTLIHDLIVLTAAHCFTGRPRIREWTVEGGVSKLTDRGIMRRVKTIVKSKQFRDSDMNMDVALIRLDKAMTGKNIGKLALCSNHLRTGTLMKVSGWGMIKEAGMGPETLLRTVTVPVLGRRKCRKDYKPTAVLTDSMFCASILGKKDACTFDSGGPLVYQNQVCGIVSFGLGCASPKYAGVYTDVVYTKPFIEKTMKILL